MSYRPTGNHKHLTLSQRISIEHSLAAGKSFREIAALTGKDPSTISKEIRKHSQVKERSKSKSFAKILNRLTYVTDVQKMRIVYWNAKSTLPNMPMTAIRIFLFQVEKALSKHRNRYRK